jgi:hypothetical protein
MTLREIHSILSSVAFPEAMLNQNGQVLGNLPRFKKAVSQLSAIPQFQQTVTELQSSPLYSVGAEDVGLGGNATVLKQKADTLLLGALGLKEALDRTLPNVPPESILVKLPAESDLSSVVGVMERLEKALGQLVTLQDIDGKVEITSWETGSLLIFLFLKSLAAVELVGRALRAAAIVYQEIQKGRLTGQHVRILKVKVDSLRDVEEAQEKLLQEIVEQQARTVESATFSSHEPERLERLKACVKMLADLLDRGTTVYPALGMPTKAKDQFPDLDRISSVLSQMKQLEDSPPSSNGPSAESPERPEH